MKKDIKKRWIAALQSGLYPKVNGNLRTSAGYCALGVLAEIVGGGRWAANGSAFNYVTSNGTLCGTALDGATLKDIRLSVKDQEAIIKMNDSEGKSFSQIAAYLKSNDMDKNYREANRSPETKARLALGFSKTAWAALPANARHSLIAAHGA